MSIIQIRSQPGIKRDGTRFEGDAYVDGQWCRFQRGLPRKMGGYRSLSKRLFGIGRTLHEYTQDLKTYIHVGESGRIERFYIDGAGNASPTIDRTPLTGFTNSANNLWQFDVMFQTGVANQIIAQVAPNLECICNSTGGELFIGDLLGTVPLTPIALPAGHNATGGIVVLHPYLFYFGTDGFVGWSEAGDPTSLTGGAVSVTGQKIIRGMSLRGGPGNSPAGLFWSADSVIRAAFVGGAPVFQFDTITTQSSIMSAQSVIEYDGVFYWAGVDRFLMFNGVVREIPNPLNLNWFFDNLNFEQRQKVFATKVPKYGEIWWCYPRGSATECTHAVVYNVREQTWYDTALPDAGRSSGLFTSVYRKPVMTGVDPVQNQTEVRVTESGDTRITESGDTRVTMESEVPLYKVWLHETGVDSIDGTEVQPVLSYFETADFALPVKGENRSLQVVMVEPDFVQSGPLTMQVMGRANARAPEVDSQERTIVQTPSTPQEQVVYFKELRRELRFRFTSNAVGGDYQMGQILAHVQPADGTVIG